jgi:hypothetical protein
LHAESVLAAPFLGLQGFNGTYLVEMRNGTSEIVSSAATTTGVLGTLAGAVLVAAMVILRWRGKLESLEPTDVVLAALLVLVATSRILSPQFYVWLAAVLAIALLSPRTQARPLALLVVASAVAAQYVYPFRTGFPDTDSVVLQIARVTFLATAAFWGVAIVFRAWLIQRMEAESSPTSHPQTGTLGS